MEVIDSFAGPWRTLSNFSPAQIRIPDARGDLICPTAEHAFQVLKTDDWSVRVSIAAEPTPAGAKQCGQRAPLRPHWDVLGRYEAMHWVLQQKFLTDPNRAGVLLATGGAVLVEGNTWHDNTWGDCHCGRPACARPGHNLLGWMLMRLRSTEVAPRFGG
jgi:ribA/ribD-fused uncharacterized protein